MRKGKSTNNEFQLILVLYFRENTNMLHVYFDQEIDDRSCQKKKSRSLMYMVQYLNTGYTCITYERTKNNTAIFM